MIGDVEIVTTPFGAAAALCRSLLHIDLLVGDIAVKDEFKQEHFVFIAQQALLVPSDDHEFVVGFRTTFQYAPDVHVLLRNVVARKIDRAIYASGQTWKVRSIRVLQHTIIMCDVSGRALERENQEVIYINLVAYKLVRVGIFELAGIQEPLYVEVPEHKPLEAFWMDRAPPGEGEDDCDP